MAPAVKAMVAAERWSEEAEQVQIINADESHFVVLCEMAREYWGEADPENALLRDQSAFDAECQRLFNSSIAEWGVKVAVARGDVIAFIVYGLVEDNQALMIYEFYVRPWTRRKGIGRALLADVLSGAAARGVEYAGTAIDGWNSVSFQLFQAMGFGVNRYLMGRRGDLAAAP